jgi:5,5'-dehydrodivanillate O-demethylase
MSVVSENVQHVQSARESVSYDCTGPGTAAGRYLRQFWVPVADASEVAPGRAKSIQIMSERFTLYRGTTGEPHLVANYCAHRGTILGTGWVDGDDIRCFYHGWKYDGTGQCVEQPAEEESFAHKVQIRGYPVREYLGFIFAFLGTGEPPEFQELELFSGPGVRDRGSYVRKTNFFNSLENSVDWIHVYFVHGRSGFTTGGVNREIPRVRGEETDYGVAAKQEYTDGKTGLTYILMPLAMYIIGSGTRLEGYEEPVLMHQMAWRVPIDDHSHRSFNLYYADVTGKQAELFIADRDAARTRSSDAPTPQDIVSSILRGEMHIDEVDENRADIVGIQDTITLEPQPPMSERVPDRLAASDGPVILLRRIFARETRAFARGEAVKQWVWPRDLRAIPQI